MKVAPHRFLTVVIVIAVPVAFCRRAPEPGQVLEPPSPAVVASSDTAILRLVAKRLIAREAADGRRSLVEAAALFGALNRLPPEPTLAPPPLAHPLTQLPGRTDEELLCQHVIASAGAVLHDESPGEVEEAVARLEAEFWEELHRHGALRLPDPSGLPSAHELLEQARKAMTPAERKALFGGRPGAP